MTLHNPAQLDPSLVGPNHKLLSTEDLSKPLPEGAEYWCTTPDQWCPSWRMIPNPNITYRIPLTLSDRLKAERDRLNEQIRVVEAVESGAEWEIRAPEQSIISRQNWSEPDNSIEWFLSPERACKWEVRIKPAPPTPHSIPWTLESHPDVVCLKREINGRYVHANPTHWDEHGATVSGAYYTYRELHSDWLQRNGEPAGEKVTV